MMGFPSDTAERGRSRPTIALDVAGQLRPCSAVLKGYIIVSLWLIQSTVLADYEYESDIAPILEQYCVKCHGPKKQKSKFRLDTYKGIMTPGSSDEKPIVPYSPMQSPLIEYLLLPKEDDYAMPPEDEDSPTPEEILTISHWIYYGAKSLAAQRNQLPLEELLDKSEFSALRYLRARGALIDKAGKKNATLVADLQHLENGLSGQALKSLSLLAPYIGELRLPGLDLSDDPLGSIGEMENLNRLDLRGTSAGDEIVNTLNKLQSLEYLNLFATRITDTGLRKLHVPISGQLFLGSTQVTENGLKTYQLNHPELILHGNVDLNAVLKITNEAKNSSTTFHPESASTTIKKLPPVRQVSESGIRHSFLVMGKVTALFDEASQVVWETPEGARDGMVLKNGNILLSAKSEVREYLKGTQEVVWSYKLDPRNKELGTAVRLGNGNTLIIERGVLPRLLEVDAEGRIATEVPLQPDTDNIHMQTRMARKLPNGNYLVPHTDAFVIKEYTPDGTVLHTIPTDLPELGGRDVKNWPFTAILLPNGNILANLTRGHKSVEFKPNGSIAWSCATNDIEGRIVDACGGQRLPNGNTIICSYGQKEAEKVKVIEVTPEKEVVWEFFHPEVKPHQIHVLTTNGEPVSPLLR